ncbi:uncharacterized protein LOC126198655 isoform X1 [Schistocerca nitens]|uniref:uncharacterized protein LOC126198655 isoform X1 n=2 Tax=Schistocerca nitens TaxID=7011 RepID=UPI002119B136|nr:uncharacterized protein LOC126198655 isoform X1 [Schistocerca nitens]
MSVSGETRAHKKSTEMITFASAFVLCFVLFIGIKLRWFRARMRFDTNTIRSGSSSVAAASAPTFSVAGVYRPIGNSSPLESQVQTFYPKTEQKHHHKSMPNLTENLNVFPKDSLGIADVTTKTQSVQQNLSTSSKTGMLASNAEDHNSAAASFGLMKLKENGNIYSSTPDMSTANHSQTESRQKKKTTKSSVNTKLNVPETEEPETEAGNLIFLNSNGKPISLLENKSTKTVSHKTRSKAPAPPAPPALTNPKFHEYEEFDT